MFHNLFVNEIIVIVLTNIMKVARVLCQEVLKSTYNQKLDTYFWLMNEDDEKYS